MINFDGSLHFGFSPDRLQIPTVFNIHEFVLANRKNVMQLTVCFKGVAESLAFLRGVCIFFFFFNRLSFLESF